MLDRRGEPDWKLIAESVPHIVWMSAPDGSTEYLNQRGTDYTGLPAEASSGSDWFALVHPDDAERARCGWENAVRSCTLFELEYRIRRSDGEFRWHMFRGLPIRGPGGEVLKWISTATEIEEQKRLQGGLLQAQRRAVEASTFLETFLAAAPVGFGFVDTNLRVVRINEELAAVNGAPIERQLGRTVAELIPELWPQVEAAFRHVLDTGETVHNVTVVGPLATDGGQVHEWVANYYPIAVDGEIIGVGLVAIDITERAQAEAFRAAVMSQVGDGVYTQDCSGLLTSMNRSATRMLGWSEDELRGRRVHDVIHFQTADGTRVGADECALLTRGVEGPLVRAVGEAFTRKDGSVFPIAFSSVPLRIGSSVEGVAVVFRDISEPGLCRPLIRVMIVEKHAMISEAFHLLLSRHEGVEVVGTAATSASALTVASRLRPDVLIIDNQLSDLDGVATTRLIKAAVPEASVILMRETPDERVVADAISAGCACILDKDRAWVELIDAVRAVYNGETTISQEERRQVLPIRRNGRRGGSGSILTDRERDVLMCISEGFTNQAVAERLGVTANTVRNHVQRILYKLNVHSKLEAVVVARQGRLLGDVPDEAAVGRRSP